jgi:hypothetical protein
LKTCVLWPLQTYANIQMKHLQHTYENTWNTCIYMQHPNEPHATYVCNRWNIWNIHLKHTCINIATCATFRFTFATSI